MLASTCRIRPYTKQGQGLLARMPVKPGRADAMHFDYLVLLMGDLLKRSYASWLTGQHDRASGQLDLSGEENDLTASGTLFFSPRLGVSSDTLTGQLASDIVPAHVPGADATEGTLMVFVADDSGSNAALIAARSGPGSMSIRPRGYSGAASTIHNSRIQSPTRPPTSQGLTAISRGKANPEPGSTDYFVDADVVTRSTVAPVALPSNPVTIFPQAGRGSRSIHTVSFAAYDPVGWSGPDIARARDVVTRYLVAGGQYAPAGEDDDQSGDDTSGHDTAGPWTYADIARVTAPPLVIMPAAPPMSNIQAGYPYYPGNVAMSGSMDRFMPSATSCTSMLPMHGFWANTTRANTANPCKDPHIFIGDRECRFKPTTLQRGDDATVAAIMWTCGYTLAECQVEAPDVALRPVDDLLAHPELYFTELFDNRTRHYLIARDTTYLCNPRLVDIAMPGDRWIWLDTETQEGRTPDQLVALYTRVAAKVHAKGVKLLGYFNPIGGNGATRTGFTSASGAAIAALADLTSVLVQRNSGDMRASIDRQLLLLGNPDPARVSLTVGLGVGSTTLTPPQNAAIRQAIVDHGIGAVEFWPNGASFGGPITNPVNQSIGTILGLLDGPAVPRDPGTLDFSDPANARLAL